MTSPPLPCSSHYWFNSTNQNTYLIQHFTLLTLIAAMIFCKFMSLNCLDTVNLFLFFMKIQFAIKIQNNNLFLYSLGILFLNDIPITKPNIRFFYSDVIGKHVSYKMTTDYDTGDEIKFRITDGVFSTTAKYFIIKSSGSNSIKSDVSESIALANNQGLQAISGSCFLLFTSLIFDSFIQNSDKDCSLFSSFLKLIICTKFYT